jgi:hypothetical protein
MQPGGRSHLVKGTTTQRWPLPPRFGPPPMRFSFFVAPLVYFANRRLQVVPECHPGTVGAF